MNVLDKLDRVETLILSKHLPGKHDQSLHAGKRRGSRGVSSAPTGGDDAERKAALDYYLDGVRTDRGRRRVMESEGPRIKNEVVTQLAEDSGLDYDRANELVAAWADTSNNAPASLGMQKAVSEEFGVELSDYQKRKIDTSLDSEQARDQHRGAVRDGRKLTRAMYDRTQKELAEAGVKEVVVHRGMAGPEVAARSYRRGTESYVTGNAMESWSLKNDIAYSFAETRAKQTKGSSAAVILSAKYPASRVLSTSRTGFGALGEFEVVVMGAGSGELDVVRVSVPRL